MLRGQRASGGRGSSHQLSLFCSWVFSVLWYVRRLSVGKARPMRGCVTTSVCPCSFRLFSARVVCSRRSAPAVARAGPRCLLAACVAGCSARADASPGLWGASAGGRDPCWSRCSWAFPAGWLEHSHAGCLSLPLRLPSVSPTRHHVTAQQRQRELHVGRARSISRDKARCA